VKFTEHFERVRVIIEKYNKSIIKGINYNPERSAISSWANGATDHLYGIEVPKCKDWDAIRKKVDELTVKAFAIRNDYTNTNYTEKDVIYLRDLSREIALMIDKKIGLKPDIGEW